MSNECVRGHIKKKHDSNVGVGRGARGAQRRVPLTSDECCAGFPFPEGFFV